MSKRLIKGIRTANTQNLSSKLTTRIKPDAQIPMIGYINYNINPVEALPTIAVCISRKPSISVLNGIQPPANQQFLMKPRQQSQQFPAHMSEYYRQKEETEQTLEIVNEDTTDSVFHRKVFSICDIMGNVGEGFILVHFEGYIYLVDQHAASEKSLFLQYMINPTQKYSVDVQYYTSIPNFLRPTLYLNEHLIRQEGWHFQELKRKAFETELELTKAPILYNKELQEEDFTFLLQRLYADKTEEDPSNTQTTVQQNSTQPYSANERNAMATYACRNAYKVGDKLKPSQMRGLLDSLYKMDAPFNCPHGRPTIAAVGRVIQAKKAISIQKQYNL